MWELTWSYGGLWEIHFLWVLSCPGPQFHGEKEHHLVRKHQNSCKYACPSSALEMLGGFVWETHIGQWFQMCFSYTKGWLTWRRSLCSVRLLHRAFATMKCMFFTQELFQENLLRVFAVYIHSRQSQGASTMSRYCSICSNYSIEQNEKKNSHCKEVHILVGRVYGNNLISI